ncbi:MAG TPA: hypothetical protein VFH54_11020, partial [Mycobacteriales bacterium]|nr:hypothetical protein [Mycobacteriales bacterium]
MSESEANVHRRRIWWNARDDAPSLLDAGEEIATCWDLGAVGRVLYGGSRDDPPATWAHAHGLEPPARQQPDLGLFAFDDDGSRPVRADGHLSSAWIAEGPTSTPSRSDAWARLAIETQRLQHKALLALADPRPSPTGQPLAVLTAHAESAAALL